MAHADPIFLAYIGASVVIAVGLLIFYLRTMQVAASNGIVVQSSMTYGFWSSFIVYIACGGIVDLWFVRLKFFGIDTLNIWLICGFSFSGVGLVNYCLYHILNARLALPLKRKTHDRLIRIRQSFLWNTAMAFCAGLYFFYRSLR